MWIKFRTEKDPNWKYVWCEDEDPVTLVEQYLHYRGQQNAEYEILTTLEQQEYEGLSYMLSDRLCIVLRQINLEQLDWNHYGNVNLISLESYDRWSFYDVYY